MTQILANSLTFFEVLEYIWNKHIPQVNRVHVEGACTMHRIDDMPLVLQYQAANLGIIRFCIASLEEHNRNNAKTNCTTLDFVELENIPLPLLLAL